METEILRETPDYVVCIKPWGVDAQYGMPALLSRLTGHTPILPVHRLDKDTGGVMVYAKSKKAAAWFSREIAAGRMEKTYLALVGGCPQPSAGQWEDLLFRDGQRNKSYVVQRMRKGVKKAVLFYETLHTAQTDAAAVSLVRVRLQTGRTHQIRVQFASRGMPLLGDKKYGGALFPRLALWSTELAFDGPAGECCRFVCDPPWNDWEKGQIEQ